MTLIGLPLRFIGIYLAVSVTLMVILKPFGLWPSEFVTALSLGSSVILSCLWFSKLNRRYLTSNEKWQVALGMWGFFMSLQVAGLVLMNAASGGSRWTPGAMVVGLAFTGLFYLAGTYFCINVAEKKAAKWVEANG